MKKSGGTLSNALLVAVALIWVLPYAWMFVTSLKSLPELLSEPLRPWPRAPSLEAYRAALRAMPLARYVWNTTLMSLGIAVLQIGLALPAGYALAKLRFRWKSWALLAVVSTLIVPAQVRFVPVFTLLAGLGLTNTLAALILPFAVSALGTFLVRQALLSVPDALVEAARIDGASELRIVFGLLPPLLVPTLTSLFLFSFVSHWNDYFWPLVMTTDDRVRTLPLGVALLREQGTGVRWHIVMAANMLLSAPVLALFAVAQRRLLRAITASTS